MELRLRPAMSAVYLKLAEVGWRSSSSENETRDFLKDLSREERLRLRCWEVGLFIYGENSFYQYQQGFYDKEFYDYDLLPYVKSRGKLWLALELARDTGMSNWVEMVKAECQHDESERRGK